MEDEKRLLYAIWLSQACGHNPTIVHRILKKYHTPQEAFHADHFDSGFYKLLKLSRLLTADRTLESAKRLLDQCGEQEIQIFDWDDPRYPKQLRHCFEAPLLLYGKGNLPDMNQMLGISVVGTRRATEDGEKITQLLAKNLAENGVTIVSGMALGIDGAAHCGALEAGGTTIAVLAGGVDVIYPTEHTALYRHILTHGGVLSEQPPGVIGKPNFYKQRNRIIVGLSYGTMVVEGELKSGTSMSARLATENNRDIFAVPGNPINKMAALPNNLIRDGAKQVMDHLDILEEYLTLYPERLMYGIGLKGKPVTGKVQTLNHPPKTPKAVPKEKPKPTVEELSYQLEQLLHKGAFKETEKEVLRYLCQKGEKVSFDDLAKHCTMPVGILSSTLIVLQMKQLVVPSAGGQYCIQLDSIKEV